MEQIEINEVSLQLDIKKIEQILRNKKDRPQYPNGAVVVIGNTGVGKSTIINIGLGNKFTYQKNSSSEKGKSKLDTDGKGPLIGHQARSQTSFVQSYDDEKNTVKFVDTPGFQQTKSSQQDIINNMQIKQLFKLNDKLKLIIALQYSQLEVKRGSSFYQLIQKLYRAFPQLHSQTKSIFFIITKVQSSIQKQEIKEKIEQIYQERKVDIKDQKFLEFLQKIEKLDLVLFPKIKSEKNFNLINQFHQNFLEAIKQKQYSSKFKLEKMPLSAQTQNKVLKTGSKCEKLIKNFFKEKIQTDIKLWFQKQLNLLQKYNLLKITDNYFQNLQKISNVKKNKYLQQIQLIKDYLKIISKIFEINIQLLLFYFHIMTFKQELDNCSQFQPLNFVSINSLINQFLIQIQDKILNDAKHIIQKYDSNFKLLLESKAMDQLLSMQWKINQILNNQDQLILSQIFEKKLFLFQNDLKVYLNKFNLQTLKQENVLYKNMEQIVQQKNSSFLKSFLSLKLDQIFKMKLKKDSSQKFKLLQMQKQKSLFNEIKVKGATFNLLCNEFTVQKHLFGIGQIKEKMNGHKNGQNLKEKLKKQIGYLQRIKQSSKGIFECSFFGYSLKSKQKIQLAQKKKILMQQSNFLKEQHLTKGYYVYLFAGSQLVLDDDINVYGNIILIAPTIIINPLNKQKICISSVGISADKLQRQKAEQKKVQASHFKSQQQHRQHVIGNNGKDGSGGYPGGNVIIITTKIVNQEKLQINVCGGNSSNGQHGGDGPSCNMSFILRPSNGQGGNGGKGGNSFYGGKKGSFSLFNQKGVIQDHKNINLIAQDGKNGIPGQGGKGGKGWGNQKNHKNKFRNGYAGNNGLLKTNQNNYSSSILTKISFRILKEIYSQKFIVRYRQTGYKNFLED